MVTYKLYSFIGYCSLGTVLRLQQKIDQSIEAFYKAVDLNSNEIQVHLYLGTLLYEGQGYK